MKIERSINQNAALSDSAAQDKGLERLIIAAKGGDWEARDRLVKNFMPVIREIAGKCQSTSKDNLLLVEAGRRGVIKAAKKYRPSQGPHGFRVAVVADIEHAIDSAVKGSFFSKLFGG